MTKLQATIYDPDKSFDDNVDYGPFPSQPGEPAYTNSGEPKYSFLGHELYSPFGIAAGSLPTSKHIKYAFERGFDVVTYKTQRTVVFKANQFPNVVYLDIDGDLSYEKSLEPQVGHTKPSQPIEKLTITNSFGNPSRGPEFWASDMKKAAAAAGKGQLLIASVVGTIQDGFSQEDYYDDFARAAKIAVEGGAEVIEINLSCPNVANEGILCYSKESVISVAKKVKSAVGDVPVVAKIGYYTPQQQGLLREIVEATKDYIAAFATINTIPAAIVDENGEQMLPGEGRLKSGVCGAGIKWAGLEMTKRLNDLRQELGLNYEIIGVGGVSKPEDVKAYLDAGANIVQCVTAAMWNDRLAEQVKDSL